MENKEKGFSKGIFIGILLGVLLMTAVALSFFAVKKFIRSGTKSDTSVINNDSIQKINTIQKLIDENFYEYSDEVGTEELEDGMYRGIIDSLNDPYSEYFSAAELKSEINDINGVSYGIGVVVSTDNEMEMPMVTSVMSPSPAEEAGVMVGDVIYEVEGASTSNMSLSEVVSRVKGEEGTTVHISFYRQGDIVEMDIVRGKLIENNTVLYGYIEDEEASDIAYISITEFDDITLDQFSEALAELKEKGMSGLILDLRYNFGGSLNTCVEICRRILPEGMIVYTEDKNGKREEYTCDGSRELTVPLVVLVNEYTASASEIVAGAIQDHNAGTIVGTTTYGKGIVQRIISMEDGSAVKLTISAYFTPSGRNIQGTGIEPDIEVEFDRDTYEKDGTDNQVEKAVEIIKQKAGI